MYLYAHHSSKSRYFTHPYRTVGTGTTVVYKLRSRGKKKVQTWIHENFILLRGGGRVWCVLLIRNSDHLNVNHLTEQMTYLGFVQSQGLLHLLNHCRSDTPLAFSLRPLASKVGREGPR